MDFLSDNYISISVAVMVAVMVFIHFNLKDRNANKYIALALLGVDLLPASMAITWASSQGEGLTSGLFVLGFISFVALKLLLVWLLHKALSNGNTKGVWYVIGTMVIIYGVILAAAAFNGSIGGAKAAAQEAVNSAPIKSIDAQILAAENKLAGLATFSDAGKANSEGAKAQRLNAQLLAAQAALAKCPANYLTKCIRPNMAKVEGIQSQLNALTYHTGNQDYSGTLAHLAVLQDRRSTFLSSGGIASTSGLGADDRFLARLFDKSVEEMRDIKMFVFMVVFDFITILIRIVVTFVNRGVNEAEILSDQVFALAKAGNSTNQIIAVMAANAGLTQLPDRSKQDAFNGGVSGTSNHSDNAVPVDANSGASEGAQGDNSKVVAAPTRGRSEALSIELEGLYLKWSEMVKIGGMRCSQDPAKKFILKGLSGGKKKHSISPVGAVAIHKEWLERGTTEGYLRPYVGNLNKSHELIPESERATT